MFLTYQDAVERLIDYLGAQPSDSVLRDAKQATIEALRDLVQSHPWTYLYTHGRILTYPSFTDGTITYLVSDGVNPCEITLTDAIWPPWAATGTIRIGNINYDVARRADDLTLNLVPAMAPPDDITDPTPYGLFQDTYSLPRDFASQDVTFIPNNFCGLQYVHPREWLAQVSEWTSLGDPVIFSIMADPTRPSGLCVKLAPFPSSAQVIEFIYKRHGHKLSVFKECAGTVSTTNGLNTIIGTGTSFSPLMVGSSVIRISAGPKKLPTAEFGDNPADFESKIMVVGSNLSLMTFDPVPITLIGAPYTISNYIDIEVGAMTQAFLRCCEFHISMSRVMKDKPSARLQYAQALEVAKCADSRNMMARAEGVPMGVRRRLKDYPINLNVEV